MISLLRGRSGGRSWAGAEPEVTPCRRVVCLCGARSRAHGVHAHGAHRMLRAAVLCSLAASSFCFLPATSFRGAAPSGRGWGSAERGCGIRGRLAAGTPLRLTGGKGIPEHCGGKAPGWARAGGARGRVSTLRVKRDGVRAGQCCDLCCTVSKYILYRKFSVEHCQPVLGQCCMLHNMEYILCRTLSVQNNIEYILCRT
jgi:hypothetical protein